MRVNIPISEELKNTIRPAVSHWPGIGSVKVDPSYVEEIKKLPIGRAVVLDNAEGIFAVVGTSVCPSAQLSELGYAE